MTFNFNASPMAVVLRQEIAKYTLSLCGGRQDKNVKRNIKKNRKKWLVSLFPTTICSTSSVLVLTLLKAIRNF